VAQIAERTRLTERDKLAVFGSPANHFSGQLFRLRVQVHSCKWMHARTGAFRQPSRRGLSLGGRLGVHCASCARSGREHDVMAGRSAGYGDCLFAAEDLNLHAPSWPERGLTNRAGSVWSTRCARCLHELLARRSIMLRNAARKYAAAWRSWDGLTVGGTPQAGGRCHPRAGQCSPPHLQHSDTRPAQWGRRAIRRRSCVVHVGYCAWLRRVEAWACAAAAEAGSPAIEW